MPHKSWKCNSVLDFNFYQWTTSSQYNLIIHAIRYCHADREDQVSLSKGPRLRCSTLSKPFWSLIFTSCCWRAVQCMHTKPVFTGNTGGQFIVQIPQSATCFLSDSNQVMLRPSNTQKNSCHVGVGQLTVFENQSCKISLPMQLGFENKTNKNTKKQSRSCFIQKPPKIIIWEPHILLKPS